MNQITIFFLSSYQEKITDKKLDIEKISNKKLQIEKNYNQKIEHIKKYIFHDCNISKNRSENKEMEIRMRETGREFSWKKRVNF